MSWYRKKKPATDVIRNASKRATLKTTERSGDLIRNKIADKITSVSKKSSSCSKNNEANDESDALTERCISPEKRQQINDKLRLV